MGSSKMRGACVLCRGGNAVCVTRHVARYSARCGSMLIPAADGRARVAQGGARGRVLREAAGVQYPAVNAESRPRLCRAASVVCRHHRGGTAASPPTSRNRSPVEISSAIGSATAGKCGAVRRASRCYRAGVDSGSIRWRYEEDSSVITSVPVRGPAKVVRSRSRQARE